MITIAASIVQARSFQRAIVAIIVLAGVLAGVETSAALNAQYGTLLHTLDVLVLAVFGLEAALKIVAHGRQPWRYFADGWNVFDFTILVVCLLPVGGPFAAVLRLARALRLLRLVTALPKLQLLVGALLKSLTSMGYVGLLLGMMFYIYAVAGVHLFGAHDPKNFGSLGTALFSLFRIVTLDDWAAIYAAQLAHVPVTKAAIYFVSFIPFGTMIVLNLFIGIVMNGMSEMHDEMAERDRARHLRETGAPTLEDELIAIEQEMKTLQTRIASLRRHSVAAPEPSEPRASRNSSKDSKPTLLPPT